MCKELVGISCIKGEIVVKECGKTTPYTSYAKRGNGVVLSGDFGSRYLSLNSIVGFYDMPTLCESLEECICYVPQVEVINEEVEKEQFVDPRPCVMFDSDDTKLQNPINLVEYFDCVNNSFVQFEEGVEPTAENIFNTENYIKMSNIAGNVIPENLAGKTAPACVTLCIDAGASITFADVLAEAIADGVLLPDGTAPTGFLLDNVMNFQVGQLGKDADGVTKKVGSQVVYLDTDEAINAGSTYCPSEPVLIDEDCDGFFVGYDETRAIENGSTTEAAIVRVCGTFIPFDTDDADETVQ